MIIELSIMSHLETDLMHEGVRGDEQHGSVVMPIYQAATFYMEGLEEEAEYKYSRYGNPTCRALEDNLSMLEGGVRAFATASGNAAIQLVLALLKAGDHVICGVEVHGGTYLLIKEYLGKFGVESSFLDLQDIEAVKAAVRVNTKMIWIETPTNPLMKVVDIAAMAEIAGYAGALCVVDNTVMTPFWQKPMEFGADIVVYSSTKYLNGHSDVISGAVVVRTEDLAQRLQYWISLLGVGESPMDAWLVLRGMKTLPQRLRVHAYNAQRVAEYLAGCVFVKKVYYPGFAKGLECELIKKQQKSFGGMVFCEVDLERLDLKCFIKSLKYFRLSHGSGGVVSNISHPWSTSHNCLSEEVRCSGGVTEGLLRISPGLEHHDDLIKDLQEAFATAAKEGVLV